MAFTFNGLTTQLLEKLSDGNLPTDKKLELCKIVFTSPSIPILQKEDCILDYLSVVLKSENVNGDERICYFECLKDCLSSGRMKDFRGSLRPGVVDGVLQVIGNFREHEEFKIASECIINLLSTPYFQRWLRCDVSGLCKLLGSFFNKVTATSYLECIKVLSLCLNIHRITLLRDDFREHFINETYFSLAYAYSIVKDDEYNSFRSKAVSCIIKILLCDKSFIGDFITIMQLHKSDELNQDEAKDIKAFCNKMKKLPSNCNVDVVSASLTLFLYAVAQNDVKQENSKQVFKVFMALCKVLGIRVDRIVSISISPIKKWTHEESFEVIGNMIDVLSESNLPLCIDFQLFTSQTWMVSLVIGMTNINLSNLTPQLLKMVKKAFHFNNLIIEPCLRVISNIVLRNKTDLVKPHYVDLMKTVFEGASKAQRFQKIITLFLAQIRDVLIAFSQTLDIEDIFPKEVAKAFSNTILTLAHSQVLVIMKSFLFHLEHDCLNFIQSGCIDSTVVTNTEIICTMINQLFKVVKIADHNTPDVVKAKFNNLLDDLKTQLQKFGEIFTCCHHDNLIKAYLSICHSYGAMKLMIEEYEGCPLKKLTSNDLNPTNLCFVHPYLDPSAWNIIVTKIVEHDGCLATPELYKLLIQKIEAVSQIEEGCEGPGTQASRLVLEIAENSWLWDELIGLSGLFEAKELLRLIRRLVHECGNDQSKWKTIVSNELFKEDRRLVLATAIRLLYKASKIMNHSDGTVSFDVTAYVPDETLLEYELALLITDDVELEEEIVNSITAMVSTLEQALLTEQPKVLPSNIPHISFFEVLEQLPLHCMSVLSQSCIFHSVLALLYDLPPNQDVDNILFDILLRLIVASKKCGSKLLGGLDVGVLFIFVVDRSKEYPMKTELLQKICSLSLMEKPTAKQLLNRVCEPSKDDLWLTTMVIQSLMQKQKKQISSDDENNRSKPLNREKCISRLVSLCIPILENEEPHTNLLNGYTTVLKWILSKEETQQLKPLVPKLDKYVEIAMANYKLGVQLISTLITYRSDVGNFLPSNILTETWNHFLFISEEQPDENLIHLLLTKSTIDEYEKLMSLLSQGIEMQVGDKCNEKILNKTITIMNHVVTCGLEKSEKSRQRENIILQLVKPFIEIIALWPSKGLGVEAILEFFTNLAPSTYIVLRPAILDLDLLALSSVPLPSEDKSTLLKNLILAVKALFALYLFRTSLMLDRIPILLQRYRQYLEALAPCGHPNNSTNIILEATDCADKLERFAKTMAKRQRDFTRIAPYMVADLINIFERHQLHVDVKLVYTNIANVFLNLCDSHGITYLKAVSSPALFNTIYDNYKKYYRYVGKI
ncbi:uncharacterized protein LOC106665631 [Cimex lectularius]|uniref:Nucleolar 27S pre-rRNA processing Urb2/Npa2 C-terminal domain-containing protein n=1 Tax=Cimex lectularius TaxID=79782 RepID=A0A8I6TFX2_CIMLE|nr:uncharacterized protein LOC106665631 [Cimex lectularius]